MECRSKDKLIKKSAHLSDKIWFFLQISKTYQFRTSMIVVRTSKNLEILLLWTSKIFPLSTSLLEMPGIIFDDELSCNCLGNMCHSYSLLQRFIREGCLQKLSKKGYQQRMFFLVSRLNFMLNESIHLYESFFWSS